MSKKYEVSIPKKHKSFKDKTEYLIEEIKAGFSKLDGIEKKGVECAVRLGQSCLLLKKFVKGKKKRKWEDFVKENFSQDIRTIQRYMKLASKVFLEEDPTLALLGQTRLYELVNLAGKDTVCELLEDNDIDIEIDLEDQDSIPAFKKEVDEFIQQQKKTKRANAKGVKTEDPKSKTGNGDDEITVVEISSMDENELVELLKENGVDLDDDDWKTKKELQNLLIEHFGLASDDNDNNDDNDNDDNDNNDDDNDNDDNDNDDNDNNDDDNDNDDNDNDDNDNDDNDNDNDDNQKGKSFKKFKKSASSFLDSIDSVIETKRVASVNQKAQLIEKVVKKVERKLAKLKNYRDSLLKKGKEQ
jgi:hypothetical protein